MADALDDLFAHVPVPVLGLVLAVATLALGLALFQGWRLLRAHRRLRERLFDAQTQLAELKNRDSLTGLKSRAEFEAALEPLIADCDRVGDGLAVLYVGLDGFANINQAYGMRIGDGLLREVANRLSRAAEPRAPLARVTGDEFALVVRGRVDDALTRAAELGRELGMPYQVEQIDLQPGVSVGVALYPQHGSRPRLVPHAALAMRSVKLGGGSGHALYDPAMSVNLREQAELLKDLRQAVARRELQLYYQPKIDARTLQVTAVEALLRWQHPLRGMVSPDRFVPLAERHGLIDEIGSWVVEEACRQAAQWREGGLRMRIAINVSGLQFRRQDWVNQLCASLARHQIPPGRLTCEITETVAMEDTEVTHQAFERLRKAGLHLSIDDFGTGHSSLAHLRRLPAQELKIDRAFVQDLVNGEQAHVIVKAVVQMAHSLGMRVVAEGVETEAQRDELVRLNCDELQGYLFAKPMPARLLTLWASGDDSPDTPTGFRPSLFDPTAPAPLHS